MANKILTGAGWENRVRYVLGVDEAYLPNEVLKAPDCIGTAESNIIGSIPGYTSVSGNNEAKLEHAVVLECAILACRGMPARLPKKEAGPHRSHELDIDWDKLQAQLEGERDRAIADILEDEFGVAPGLKGTAFVVTKPCRVWEK